MVLGRKQRLTIVAASLVILAWQPPHTIPNDRGGDNAKWNWSEGSAITIAIIIVALGRFVKDCAIAYAAQYTSGFHGQVADENLLVLAGERQRNQRFLSLSQ